MLRRCSGSWSRSLEQILECQLNLSLRAGAGVSGARDCAERSARQARGREEKVRMIGQVEHLGPELKLMALGQSEEARNANIEVVQSVTANQIAPGVTERSRQILLPGRAIIGLTIP